MRILWISDSPTTCSGYGTVTREVLGRLAHAGYNVACVGWAYQGWPYHRQIIPYDVYPADPRMLGRESVPRAIHEYQPDVVIALGDAWMIEWLKDLRLPQPYKLVVYFPVDGTPFPHAWTGILRAANAAVAYSQFGQREAAAACPGVDIRMIYHGVDTRIFRPLGDKSAFQASRGMAGKFVIGCVARNQSRKQFPILFKAFSRFAADCNEAVLYLHTDPKDVTGWDLHALVQRYGLEDRVAFSSDAGIATGGVDPEELNRIYNLMDVMVLPTMGEGFGLPIVEAMAAGVPVMATRCSACVELLEGHGELIAVEATIPVGRQCIDHSLPDGDDMLAKLHRLHDDADLRARYASAGLAFAAQFDWDRIIPQWQALLAQLS